MSRKREELGITVQEEVLKTGGAEGPGALGEYAGKQEDCSTGSHLPRARLRPTGERLLVPLRGP